MAKHIVRKNGLKYLFHDDESYELFRSGNAYFDSRQDFRNKSDNKFCKCRKPDVQADDRQKTIVLASKPNTPTLKDKLKNELYHQVEKRTPIIVDWLIDEKTIPFIKNKAIPKAKELYDVATGKTKLKFKKSIVEQEKSVQVIATQTNRTEINKEGEDALYRVFIHYLELMNALKDLKEHDPQTAENIITTLCDDDTIKKVNTYLKNNPNLLHDKEQTISLNLGRKIIQNGLFVPIQAVEIKEKIYLITQNRMEEHICQ